MLISSLQHTQGIVGYNYQKTERTSDTEIYYLHSKATHLPCPNCRSWNTSLVKTGKTRDIRGLCIGLKKQSCAFLSVESAVKVAIHRIRSRFGFAPTLMIVTPNGLPVLF